MELHVVGISPAAHSCQALIIGCCEGERESSLISEIDKGLNGCLRSLFESGEFTGKRNSAKIIHTLGRLPAQRIVLVGLGKREELSIDRLRQGGGTAAKALKSSNIRNCASALHSAGDYLEGAVGATVEGLLLGSYRFGRYRKKDENGWSLQGLEVLSHDDQEKADREAKDAMVIVEAVSLARDLVSQPGNVATPAFLAETAQEIAARCKLECSIMEKQDLEKSRMGAFLGVAQGSKNPPKLITISYNGGNPGEKPAVLVGKGITFDSGGISLKPREGMEKMKDDMAGGAAVIAVLMASSLLGLKANIVGIVPAAENLPGGGAFKPGDILTSMSGKTIEIVNTDAEGRLVLCDALYFARRFDPAMLIDIATLTGACVIALGSFATGVMGNDSTLVNNLIKAGEESGERVWQLPLWQEYGEVMESEIADLKNAGGPAAATISAAWFLKEFVGDCRWAHLDIAGTAWEDKGRAYLPKGATGVGVRLLISFLRSFASR